MKFIKKNYYILILIMIFMLLIISYYMGNLTIIDEFIYNNLYFSNNLTSFFKLITNCGSAIFLIIITLLSFIFLNNKKNSIYIGLNLLLSFTINYVFKMLFTRNRPIDINLIEVDGYSFPSGHSTVSAIFYGFIIYLIYKSDINKKIKGLLITFLSILILLIGLSRIYLGAHFATDVITSYVLALLYLVIFIRLIKNIKE